MFHASRFFLSSFPEGRGEKQIRSRGASSAPEFCQATKQVKAKRPNLRRVRNDSFRLASGNKREAERRKAHCPTTSQTSLRNSSVRGSVPCGTPPFGAHACGTRHRLLPRWLSSRTGFPAAAANGCFSRFANQKNRHAAVKHAPCGPVLVPVDRGPEAARERIGKEIRARAPHLAFAVSACRPERCPAQRAIMHYLTSFRH